MAAPTSPSDNLPSYNNNTPSTPPSKKFINRLYVPHPVWKGAKLLPLVLSISIGLIIRFAIPKPHDVSKEGWQLLAIFLTTIAGLILNPLPVGAWAFICLTVAVITKTLAFSAAFNAFTNEVIWLIVVSFFFSRGFVKTGLGDRIAMVFVRWLGKSTLGLSYGLVLSEAAICPAMPSTTARAGGIFLPIIKSLALGADSRPNDGTARKLGAFLIQSQLQASSSSSALFLTAAAQNLLCLNLAGSLGVKLPNQWVTWLKGACIPALLTLLASPYIVYKLYPPETKKTIDAPSMAKRKLEQMGPMKSSEWIMVFVMLVTVALWISGEYIKVPSVVAAMIGLSLLLLFGALTWDDCLSEKSAWDTLAWFGVLVGMAAQLNTLGVIPWLSKSVGNGMKSMSLSLPKSFIILQLAYFFIHYMFASQTAHVGALYSAFLGMQLAAKVPGVLAALTLSYNTNLFGALTHYGSGQAAVYYGAGYVELPQVFKLGIVMAVFNIIVWLLSGAAWLKIVGIY